MNAPTLSIRLDLPNGTRFGPGKAALLAEIANAGSIAAAARHMGMSYPRALRLVGEMNAQFACPLIEKFQGGVQRGGAALTPTGQQVLSLYQRIQTRASGASAKDLAAIQAAAR